MNRHEDHSIHAIRLPATYPRGSGASCPREERFLGCRACSLKLSGKEKSKEETSSQFFINTAICKIHLHKIVARPCFGISICLTEYFNKLGAFTLEEKL